MCSDELRRRFLEFFSARGGPAYGGEHKIIPSSSLLPDDQSVLLTTAGMQQFKPYFVGCGDPLKDFSTKNTATVQKCFRTSDIDEVGDETHLTFFEMLGNFSFGGYWKKEAITYAYEFLTKELDLPIDYVSIFACDGEVPKDEESKEIWRSLGVGDIREAEREVNFWGPTGNEGPCGPTTEIYVRGIEVWNLVFNEYYQHPDKTLEKLKVPGVDTGMGLERLAMAVQNTPTLFETDLFLPIFQILPADLPEREKRIIADHLRASVFLLADGVRPSNKEAGYILRRIMRRVLVYEMKIPSGVFEEIIRVTIRDYASFYPELEKGKKEMLDEFNREKEKFIRTLSKGIKELNFAKKRGLISAKDAFRIYETFGLPYEAIKDLGGATTANLTRESFDGEFKKHQEISRAGLEKQFTGGLADHQPATIKLHTANHLLLAALKTVLGPAVKQRGSNITAERLRFDFSYPQKLTDEQKRQVEELVNQKIKEDLMVVQREMTREEAEKLGAEMEFGQKYGERVTVYFIEDEKGDVFSKEFCVGPHVERTGELGRFRIVKEEAVAAGIRRLKAVLE